MLETVYQLLHSLKLVVANDAITKEQGSDIWAFLTDVYSSNPGLHSPIMELTLDIFSQFHTWLRPYTCPLPLEDVDYRHRVETCAVGLTRVFALMDVHSVETLRQLEGSFARLESLVVDLNNAIPKVIKQSAILQGLNKRRWPDLIAKIFSGKEPPLSATPQQMQMQQQPQQQSRPYPDPDKVSLQLEVVNAVVPGYSVEDAFVTDSK